MTEQHQDRPYAILSGTDEANRALPADAAAPAYRAVFGDKAISIGYRDSAPPLASYASGAYSVIIGTNCKTDESAHHAILIGHGLTATKPYQLLIGNAEVQVSREMTDEEYHELRALLLGIANGTKGASHD